MPKDLWSSSCSCPSSSCTSTMTWCWGGTKWLGGKQASGTTWAAEKPTHRTMASGKHGISLDICRTCRLEQVVSTKQPKVIRRQRSPPRKESHKNLFRERYFRQHRINRKCLYSFFPVCCWFYINRYHWRALPSVNCRTGTSITLETDYINGRSMGLQCINMYQLLYC